MILHYEAGQSFVRIQRDEPAAANGTAKIDGIVAEAASEGAKMVRCGDDDARPASSKRRTCEFG